MEMEDTRGVVRLNMPYNRRPDPKDLENVLADHCMHWKSIGLQLGLKSVVLNRVECDHRNQQMECFRVTLEYWLNSNVGVTWKSLELAITNANRLYLGLKPLENVPINQQQDGIMGLNGESLHEGDRTPVDDITQINFASFETVTEAFETLMSKLQSNVNKSYFRAARTLCIARAKASLKTEFRKTDDFDDLFDVLADNTLYCNWMNVNFFKSIATASQSRQLKELVQNYEDVIFSKTLQEVWNCIPHYEIKNKFYSQLKLVFSDENPNSVTVRKLKECCQSQLASEIALYIMEINESCIQITYLIPTIKVYETFLSALTVPQESKLNGSLQIGAWVVYHPQSVLEELRKNHCHAATSTPTLLIGYYHGLLLRNINADDLIDQMISNGLLTDTKQTIVSDGHSVHQRNWLLLECARHFKMQHLLIFCELVQSIYSVIGLQLIAALKRDVSTADAAGATVYFVENYDNAEVTLASCNNQFIEPSLVHITFFHVIDQVRHVLQSYNCKILLEQCSRLKASEAHGISLFSDKLMKQLKESEDDCCEVLWILVSLYSWCDHSILRALVDFSSEAVSLLDAFDSRLDPLQPIASYPIPCFSLNILPTDGSSHTILAVRCKQELYDSTLQYMYDIRSLLVEKLEITQHCLQLLAARSDPSIFYWTIPKCVVSLISNRVPQHREFLYSKGLLEVVIYPKLLLAIGDDITVGSRAFSISKDYDEEDQVDHLQTTVHEQFKEINGHKAEIEQEDAKVIQSNEEKSDLEMQLKLCKVEVQKLKEPKPKVQLKEDEDLLESVVPQEQSQAILRMQEGNEALEELLHSKGRITLQVEEGTKGGAKLPSYASASKDFESLIYHDVVMHKELGNGRYGTKYQVSFDGKFMAGKVLHDKVLPTGENLHEVIEQFKSDCFRATQMYHHPNIVRYFGICSKAPYKFPMILQEYEAENLTLFLERTKDTLTFTQKLKLSLEMGAGLECLHGQLIMHKNLHPSNVLIDKDGQAKISDFITPQFDEVKFSSQSSSVYTAPEVLKSHKYLSYESDVFSLGVLNLLLFTEANLTVEGLQGTVKDIKFDSLKQLICSCISDNALDRPTARGVCQQICEIQASPTAVAYEALTNKKTTDFAEAIKSGRYTIKWSKCTPLDHPTWWAHAVTIGSEVYVCGGNSSSTQSRDVFVYHTLENTWGMLPQPGVFYAVPVNIGNKLTLVGGRDTTVYKFSAKVLTFDVSKGSWTKQFPDMLTGRSRPGVVVCSHYLIVAGGKVTAKPKFSNDIEFLDLEQFPFHWKKSNIKLPTNMWSVSLFASEDNFWIIGYGDIEKYRTFVHRITITDIVSSTKKKEHDWVTLAQTIYWKCTVLSSIGIFPVVLGGENKENFPIDAICYYDFDTGTWKQNQVATLPMSRAFPAVSLVGKNAVMSIGGCSNSEQGVCEDYSVADVEIGILEMKRYS